MNLSSSIKKADLYLPPEFIVNRLLPDSIMVVRQILALNVGVRALIGQHK